MFFIQINNKIINLAQVSLIEKMNEGTSLHFGPGSEDTSYLFQGEEEALLHQSLAALMRHPNRFPIAA